MKLELQFSHTILAKMKLKVEVWEVSDPLRFLMFTIMHLANLALANLESYFFYYCGCGSFVDSIFTATKPKYPDCIFFLNE